MAMWWSNFYIFIVENVWHVHVNHGTWMSGPCGLCAHNVKGVGFLETHRCITWNNTSITIKMVDDKDIGTKHLCSPSSWRRKWIK
jgi:hypothetical protein